MAQRPRRSRWSRTGWTLAAGLLVALALATAWYTTRADDERAQAPSKAPPTPVRVAEARSDAVELTVDAVGTVVAQEQVEVTSDLPGRVRELRFREGDAVSRGQVLVELDSREEAAQLREARARAAEALRQYRRAQELFEVGFISQAGLTESRTVHETAQAQVAVQEARLTDRTIRAPFDGRVGERRVSPGALIGPGTVVTTLTTADEVKLRFAVPGTLGSRIERGQAVRAQARGDDRAFEGEVDFVSPTIDAATRSLAIEARLPPDARALRPGSFVDVVLVLDRRTGVLVPEQALQLRGDKRHLFVVGDDGVVRRAEVTVGVRRAGEVEIRSGVEPGARVVIEGLQRIGDGQPVQVLPAQAPQPVQPVQPVQPG